MAFCTRSLQRQSFVDRLATMFADWERGTANATPAATDALINEIEAKLIAFRRWVNLRRRFDPVRKPSPALAAMRERLAEFADRFRQTGPDDKLLDDIGQLSTDLASELSRQVLAAIDRFRTDIDGLKSTDFGKPYAAKLDGQVVARLDEAKNLAAVPDQYAAAVATLNDARLSYNRILAAALNTQIPINSPDSLIPQPEWDAIVSTVRQAAEAARTATDADTAAGAYEQAYSLYLNRLLKAMEVRLNAASERVKAAGTLTQEQRDQLTAKLQEARKLADLCAEQVANHDFTAATKSFESLGAILRGVAQALADADGQHQGRGMAPAQGGFALVMAPGTAAGLPATGGGAESLPEHPKPISVSVTEIDQRIQKNENIFALVVGVISILLGVKLLWLPSPTWGSGADYVTAILWGLGLHQVSGGVMGQFNWGTMLDKWSGGTSA